MGLACTGTYKLPLCEVVEWEVALTKRVGMTESTPLKVPFGQVPRTHRRATKLSQDDFADRIKTHRAYYSAIERGEKNITLVTLHRIAEGFGVSMSALLTDGG